MFKHKQKPPKIEYDPEIQYPVIRASICTGEKVAGFKNRLGGHFTEAMLIRQPSDIDTFRSLYGITGDIRTEY